METKGKCAICNGHGLSVLSSNNIKHLKYTDTCQTERNTSVMYSIASLIVSLWYADYKGCSCIVILYVVTHVQFHGSLFCKVELFCDTNCNILSCRYSHDMNMTTTTPLGVLFSVQDLSALPPIH